MKPIILLHFTFSSHFPTNQTEIKTKNETDPLKKIKKKKKKRKDRNWPLEEFQSEEQLDRPQEPVS